MTRVLIGALVLSLVIWAVFYYLGWPLIPSETAVVAGACLLVTFGIDRLTRRFREKNVSSKTGKPSQSATKNKSRVVKCLILALLFRCGLSRAAAAVIPLCFMDKPTAEPTDKVRLSMI